MSGNFFVSHGPALFTGLPKSTGGAWIVGFARLARKYYAQYDLKQFPFDVQVTVQHTREPLQQNRIVIYILTCVAELNMPEMKRF